MADLGGTYDANAKENNPSNALPAGEYPVVLVKSERPEGKSYLYCEFQVTAGEFQNRKIIHRFNLFHANQEPRDIAKGQFSQFCRAVGVLTPKNSTELELKPLIIKINAKESSAYGVQNNITKFMPKPMAAAPGATPAPTTQAAGAAW